VARAARLLAAISLGPTLAGAHPAAAREVRVPLQLDRDFLQQLLASQVFTDPGGTARVLDDGRGCQEIVLSQAELAIDDSGLRIAARADVWLGTWFFGFCWFPLSWTGRIEVVELPELDPARPIVRFRAVESSAAASDGSIDLPALVWDRIEEHVHPRLATYDVDLEAPLADLRAVLPLFLGGPDAARARRLIDSVSLADVLARPGVLEVGVRLATSEEPAPRPAEAGERPLTPEETRRFERSLRELDAFLTFVVKVAGGEATGARIRSELLAALIESRHDLVASLASADLGAEDPVRLLFLRSWERLAPVLRHASAGLPSEGALRYLGFVAAGDALRAIDAVGPEWGIEISTDGLRRLARVMGPSAPEDPVAYREEVDPELRRSLGFGPPLPAPEIGEETSPGAGDPGPGEPVPEALPREGAAPEPGEAPPAPPAPPAGDPLPPGPAPADPPSAWLRWLRLAASLLAREAHAEARAETRNSLVDRAIAQRLQRWVPSRSQLSEYLALVHGVLEAVAAQAQAGSDLSAFHRELYRPLLLATAWQESCWRQFVRTKSGIRPLRSPQSSVGIMQVNERVWRGFYQLAGLREDLVYNARAGAEILLRYLGDFLDQAELAVAARADTVARATYAAYNAGPSRLRRFRRGAPQPGTPLERAFSEKFRVVEAGDALAVRRCFAGEAG
jgi:soluble lytic murein transglycosylase-like protein